MVDLDAEPETIAPVVEGCASSPATRAGRSASSRARSSATTGSCCRRCHPTSWSSRGWICGRGCCAVSRCRCRCWPPTRSTSAATIRRCSDRVHVAQAPPHSRRPHAGAWRARDDLGALPAARRDGAHRADTHTTTTSTPVCGRVDSATTPPAASITAAASWVGATARSTWRTGSSAGAGQQPHAERGGRGGGAQTSTAAISMGHTIRGVRPAGWASPGCPGATSIRAIQRASGWRADGDNRRRQGGRRRGRRAGTLTLKPLTIASVAPRPPHDLVDAGGHRQRHQVLVRAGRRDDVAARGVQRHGVLAVGALDERRRHAAEIGQRPVGGPPRRQLLAVDEAVADGLLGVEVADQLVDHDLGVGRVQAVAADPVGDHRERVGHVRVGHLRPAPRHRQHDVERLEVAADLRLQRDALRLEEVGQRPRRGRVIVTGGGGRRPVSDRRRRSRVAGVTPGWPAACGGRRSRGRHHVTVCVTVAGPGQRRLREDRLGRAVAPAKPTTPATPAATPPARIRQRRAISFIDVGPSERCGVVTFGQAPTVSSAER